VLKHEGKSHFDKYKLTLPFRRSTIVRSHYFFYLLTTVAGMAVTYGLLQIYFFATGSNINTGMLFTFGFVVLLAGAISYPLLYRFGTEKSDVIIIVSVFSSFGIMMGLNYVLSVVPRLADITFNFRGGISSLTLSVVYFVVGLLLYGLSFVISKTIYNKKEF
jgi:hypothetical protein